MNVPLYACRPCMSDWCERMYIRYWKASFLSLLLSRKLWLMLDKYCINTRINCRQAQGILGITLQLLFNVSHGVPATSEFSIAVQTKARYIQYSAYKEYSFPSTPLSCHFVKQIFSWSLPIAVHNYHFMVINIVLYGIMYVRMYMGSLREPCLHM